MTESMEQLADRLIAEQGDALKGADLTAIRDEAMADYGSDLGDMDAEDFAHTAWRMGATPDHEGECINADGNEYGYENRCDECQAILVRAGYAVIDGLGR